MNHTCIRSLALLALGFPALAQNLNAVLARMDTAAPQFRAMTARMERLQHVAVIDDNTTESATMRVMRSKAKDIRVALDFTKPDVKQVAINERKVEIFYPKMNTVQEWDLGKYRSIVDQFILLGFGTTGKELQKAYTVKHLKEETMGGQKCSRIELLPRDTKVRQHYTRFELCIADPAGYPIQQKLIEPSGNHTTITYSEIKLNPELKPESLSLALPAGVKREYPQR